MRHLWLKKKHGEARLTYLNLGASPQLISLLSLIDPVVYAMHEQNLELGMRLWMFIRENEEEIMQQWEDFATSLGDQTTNMDKAELRDHAKLMLEAFAADMEQAQTRDEQTSKSKGHADHSLRETAAEAHGGDRFNWGFSITQMISEFRALRASVTQLWADKYPDMPCHDLIRFNEAIDQAVAESVTQYSEEKEQQEHLLATVLSYSSDQSYIFDLEGHVLYANAAAASLYKKHPAEIISKKIDEVDSVFASEVHRQIRHVLTHATESNSQATVRGGSGKEVVIECLFAPILGSHGQIQAIAATSRDITERKKMERSLWRKANYDHLTDVPNRRLFTDRVEHEIKQVARSGKLLALLYIDLDNFKEANDSLGHDGGDQLLQNAVARIERCLRASDTLARMGGDEFCVALADVLDKEQIEIVAKKILIELEKPFLIGSATARISGSVGVALFPHDAKLVEELVSSADQAMYAAKQSGGNQFRFFTARGAYEQAGDAHQPSRHRH